MACPGEPPTNSEVLVVAMPKSGPDDEATGEAKLRIMAPVVGFTSRICKAVLSRAYKRPKPVFPTAPSAADRPVKACAVPNESFDSVSKAAFLVITRL